MSFNQRLDHWLIIASIFIIVLEVVALAWVVDANNALADRIVALEATETPVDLPAVDREARDLFEHLEPRVARLEQDAEDMALVVIWAPRVARAVEWLLDFVFIQHDRRYQP